MEPGAPSFHPHIPGIASAITMAAKPHALTKPYEYALYCVKYELVNRNSIIDRTGAQRRDQKTQESIAQGSVTHVRCFLFFNHGVVARTKKTKENIVEKSMAEDSSLC